MPEDKKWFVYQNLNDSSDCVVASDRVQMAGIYTVADGPFDSKEEADERADEIRKRVEPL